jgi:hypothetical protein
VTTGEDDGIVLFPPPGAVASSGAVGDMPENENAARDLALASGCVTVIVSPGLRGSTSCAERMAPLKVPPLVTSRSTE